MRNYNRRSAGARKFLLKIGLLWGSRDRDKIRPAAFTNRQTSTSFHSINIFASFIEFINYQRIKNFNQDDDRAPFHYSFQKINRQYGTDLYFIYF
jgi:hypothetical protein